MTIQRGEIYFVNLDPTQGREQTGTHPVLVLSSDEINRRPLVVTAVIGTKGANLKKDYPSTVRVSAKESGLPMETIFLCFQIRSLDPARFPSQPMGSLSEQVMERIERAVRYCLDL